MKPETLRSSLKNLAEQYAAARGLPIDSSRKTAAIFREIGGNFYPPSFEAIRRSENWSTRLEKQSTHVPWSKEVQSSNSSDALLMSVFCHPKIAAWKGVRDLLRIDSFHPEFGVKPRVRKRGTEGDETEIDLAVGDFSSRPN